MRPYIVPFIVCPFIIGNIISDNFTFHPFTSLLGLLVLSFSYLLSIKFSIHNSTLLLSIFSLFFLCMGMLYFEVNEGNPTAELNIPDHNMIEAKVLDFPKRTNSGFNLTLESKKLKSTQNDWFSFNVKFSAFIKTDSLFLSPGEIVEISRQLVMSKSAKNPYHFDYADFMKRKGIEAFCFINKNEITSKNEFNRSNHFQNKMTQIRIRVNEYIEGALTSNTNKSIAKAMLIGNKQDLSKQTKKIFQDTGSMHVLAVSGLHVGIICGLIYFLLHLLRRFIPINKTLISLLLLSAILFYVIITGASPSVCRAGLMTGIFCIAFMMGKSLSIWHIILVSAFILLLVNPDFISEVGFQLSFLALSSIVYFKPKFDKILHHPSKPISYCIQLINLSLSAQILVFPLSIFYFNKFPIYFLLSGLIAVPLTGLIISIGLLGLSFHFIGLEYLEDKLISPIWELSLHVLNQALGFIHNLPFAIIENIHVSNYELIGTLLVLSLFILHHEKRTILTKLSLLSCIIALLSSSIILDVTHYSNDVLCVYHKTKSSLLSWENGPSLILLNPDKLGAHTVDYITGPLAREHRIKNTFTPKEKIKGNVLIESNDLRLLILEKSITNIPDNPATINYLLIRNNAELDILKLGLDPRYCQIIFDGSNNKKHIKKYSNMLPTFSMHSTYNNAIINPLNIQT